MQSTTSNNTIYSNRVWLDNIGFAPASLEIEAGRIKAVHVEKKLDGAEDFGELVISPGFIDSHVHINDPGRAHWEGFDSATAAAAAGGITTVVDMPLNSDPLTLDAASLNTKMEAARNHLSVDCAFWGGLAAGNTAELPALAKAGVRGFKAFGVDSGIPGFPGAEKRELESGFRILQKGNIDLPVLYHAERQTGITPISDADQNSYKAWLNSRPPEMEVAAIQEIAELAGKYNTRIHIVHVSSQEALKTCWTAQEKGIRLSFETCPHYLYFTADSIPDADTRYKCAPPIRNNRHRKALLDAVDQHRVMTIGSDHSPAEPALKLGSLRDAWGGISSLQYLFPATWTACREAGIELEKVIPLITSAPALLTDLRDKGVIRAGAVADLTVFDPEQKVKIETESDRHKHPHSPYLDQMLFGKIVRTFLRGNQVYDGKNTVSGFGKCLV